MTNTNKISAKDIISKVGTMMALIILCVILSVSTKNFLTFTNIMNIFKQASINCFISAGMLVVLITSRHRSFRWIELRAGRVCHGRADAA